MALGASTKRPKTAFKSWNVVAITKQAVRLNSSATFSLSEVSRTSRGVGSNLLLGLFENSNLQSLHLHDPQLI